MAHWKRLTGRDGTTIDVNTDNLAYIQGHEDHASLVFIGAPSDESPDAIHLAEPLRSQ